MEIVNLLNPHNININNINNNINNNNNNNRDIFNYQSQLITKSFNQNINPNINNLTHSNNNLKNNSVLSDSTTGIQILSNLSCNREFLQTNSDINNFNNNNKNINIEIETISNNDNVNSNNNNIDMNIDSDNSISFLNDNNFKEMIKMELSSDCSFSSGCESESDSIHGHRLTHRRTNTPTTPTIKKEKVPKTPSSESGVKKPRKSYEVSKKLEILDEKSKHGMSFVVEKYHISRSIISRWLSNIEKYRSFNKKNLKKLHKGPKASFSMEQEQIIIDKINDCKVRGEVVNGETIKHFALELSKQLNNLSFKASSGWLENFKNRHNLQLK